MILQLKLIALRLVRTLFLQIYRLKLQSVRMTTIQLKITLMLR
uniref:Uncharacterized protein n=1 Tax=virus sp. ctBM815 TaxID=2825806 RepID=A0A8S5RK05_9VIRU|nr:MAG TPA: hypothetical protein [virus sp. ctBM815]